MVPDAGGQAKRVIIIMSVYNGGAFLSEQIDSILSQECVEVSLFVRDDGSTDSTPEILAEYARRDPRIHVARGENLGAMQSFLRAAFECSLEGDYYGFSDADDVWMPDKLAYTIGLVDHAVAKGPGGAYPVAVCTRLQIADRVLNPVALSHQPRIGLRFENALVETAAPGASVLMNAAAWRLMRSAMPRRAVMHDAWVYLIITAFGRFEYGDRPTILYRQHAANVFGAVRSWRQQLRVRFGRLTKPSPYWEQAREFSGIFRDRLESEKRAVLDRYLGYRRSYGSRLAFALCPSVRAQSAKANLFYRLLFLLGRG